MESYVNSARPRDLANHVRIAAGTSIDDVVAQRVIESVVAVTAFERVAIIVSGDLVVVRGADHAVDVIELVAFGIAAVLSDVAQIDLNASGRMGVARGIPEQPAAVAI